MAKMTVIVDDPFGLQAPVSTEPDESLPPPVPVLMTVTPEQAAEWLERNETNRPVRQGDIPLIARDMRVGWKLNGETIKIAWDGSLLDGQHRLLGCVAARTSFESFVITGLPRDAQDTIDIGRKRTMADCLTLDGEKNAAILAAVARWSLVWLRGGRGRVKGETEPTHTEKLACVAAVPALRDAADFAARAYTDLRAVRPSVWGMAFLLFSEKNSIEAQVFLEKVRDGADIGKGHPAHTLRHRVQEAKDKKERLTEWELLALFILAWNYFRDGAEVKRLPFWKGHYNATNFPEPK